MTYLGSGGKVGDLLKAVSCAIEPPNAFTVRIFLLTHLLFRRSFAINVSVSIAPESPSFHAVT